MTIKRAIKKSLICLIIAVIAITFIYTVISLAIRGTLFVSWLFVFSDWYEYVNSEEIDIHQDDNRYYIPPYNYRMVSIGEVYLVKVFIIYDDEGVYTEEEMRKLHQPLVDKINAKFGGNPAKLYVGHEVPYYADTTLLWIKPYNWWRKLTAEPQEESIDEKFWCIAIYKRTKNPFQM